MAIKRCYCKHKYQDRKYGPGMRIMNYCTKGKNHRCTVCGKETSPGQFKK